MSDKPETLIEKEQDISFPSDSFVSYKKMNETVTKFVELGGGPFSKDEIESKMKDLTSISIVIKRVIPFLRYLGFITRSRFGQTGPFTFTLSPGIRDELKNNPETYDSIFVRQCKTSPAYLVIWKYAVEVKTNKFLSSAFEKHLENTLKVSYSQKGLTAWLSALDKVKLLNMKEGFISLEGIPSPLEHPPKTPENKSGNISGGGSPTAPPDEGIAPSMNINVDLKLDYRQAPDIQRDYMTWLDKMSSKPTVRVSIKRTADGKESTTEKETE